HSLRSLSAFLMGPLPPASTRDPEIHREAAKAAGLVVGDLRVEHPKVVFYDIGAVIYFLRLVVWTVPDFNVDRYRGQLRQLHDLIEHHGGFETTSHKRGRSRRTAPDQRGVRHPRALALIQGLREMLHKAAGNVARQHVLMINKS